VRVLVLLVLVSCGGPARPDRGPAGPAPEGAPPDAAVVDAPLPLEEDPPTLADRIAAMNDALGEALADATAGADCAALADRVRAVLDEHRQVRAAAAEAARRGRARELDAALEAHAERIAAAVARMRPAIAACGADPAFAEALSPFDL
jgi:hypothetical protein